MISELTAFRVLFESNLVYLSYSAKLPQDSLFYEQGIESALLAGYGILIFYCVEGKLLTSHSLA